MQKFVLPKFDSRRSLEFCQQQAATISNTLWKPRVRDPWTGLSSIFFPSSCLSCRVDLDTHQQEFQTKVVNGGITKPVFAAATGTVCDEILKADIPTVCLAQSELTTQPASDSPASHAGDGLVLQSSADQRMSCNTTALDSEPGFLAWQRAHWCGGCWGAMYQSGSPVCHRCSARLNRRSPLSNACFYCRNKKLRFDRSFSLGNYAGLLREMVVRMKNKKDDVLAMQLGNWIGFELNFHRPQVVSRPNRQLADLLVPVPSHWTRKMKKGFQATEILVDRVSQMTQIPINGHLVQATRAMAKQGTLSATGRAANVRDAFRVDSEIDLTGCRILVIDDVLTTGATASEIARILKRQGAAEVYVAVVARALGIG